MKVKPAKRTESVQEYYFSQKLAQIDRMRREGANIISLGIGSPDQPPSAGTVEALIAEAQKPASHGYQSYTGIPALRKAFAEWYKKYFHVDLNPDNEILPLMGSKEGIMHISMAFVNPGDEVLVPDPGYPTYTSVTNLVGGIVRKYDLTEKSGWLPDLDSLDKSDLSNVKLMWINYPHMPSGTKGSMALYEKLVRFAGKNNILLINDNPYSFILNKEYTSVLAVEGAKDTALELNSLSKSQNMAGWRIGMVAGHQEYIKSILKVKSNMDSGMFLPMQAAAAEALNNPDSWYDTVNEVYARRRKIVEEIMDILKCRYNKEQVGLFVWGKIPEKIKSCEDYVENILQKTHVFITPGFIFGLNGERYIRISLCATEEKLHEAKERFVKYMNER
ncbi:MAG: aminotransferase [Bacteroidetes bacterium GWE2_41_25]|nr:MAG: aminotransferase [Bacteroidetes bacterium GWA2_40_15]OFX91023.1 MAG: aminotransferase [Bacteroidetes bacterium GWC2_40_22]OFY13389.1 MAG: aminotransferase [Bacteroidetes bacterium GWE2_41_25]HBH84910.1 aminotransferase [Bacteroidales bacterium]HBQ81750.1 aminotransferase [Bacteroidales bacterium]